MDETSPSGSGAAAFTARVAEAGGAAPPRPLNNLAEGMSGPGPKVGPETGNPRNENPSQEPTQRENRSGTREEPQESQGKLYDILHLPKNATPGEIKKAYREMAQKWHPDHNRDKPEDQQQQAEEQFKDLNTAFQILRDPEKRAKYDRAESINRTAQAAEAASRVMTDESKTAFVEEGFRQAALASADGTPQKMSEMSQEQLLRLAPPAIAATAEQMYNTVTNQPEAQTILLFSGPQADVTRALAEAGSKGEAEAMMLFFIFLTILAMIQTFMAAAAHENWGNGLGDSMEYAQIVGGMRGALKGPGGIREALQRAMSALNKIQNAVPPEQQKPPKKQENKAGVPPKTEPVTITKVDSRQIPAPKAEAPAQIAPPQPEAALEIAPPPPNTPPSLETSRGLPPNLPAPEIPVAQIAPPPILTQDAITEAIVMTAAMGKVAVPASPR